MLEARQRVRVWLLTGCVLIAAMVTIGGITRLTGSGLSITEWDVVMGALPPLSDAAWRELFDKYRATPQFALINTHFGLSEFKQIFWWEYIHRLLGRAIGLVFLIPFAFFLGRGYFDRPLRNRVLLIFGLGALQGVLGWLMVASGLVDRPSVSHYRLAAHLLTALLTFAVTLWVAQGLRPRADTSTEAPVRLRTALQAFAVVLGLQLTYGAFVAGLKAGGMFNTFPLMEGALLPPGIAALAPGVRNLTENPIMVQLIHRLLGWILLAAGLLLWHRMARLGFPQEGRLLGVSALLQFGLGAATILRFPVDPVFWGALHQAGAVLLLTTTVLALHATRKPAMDHSRLTTDNYAGRAAGERRLVPEPTE